MTKFLAAVHDHESLLARRARLKAEGADTPRAPEQRPEPGASPAQPALDADMLDLVTRFEQNFAELAPARVEPQHTPLSDDLFPEFPEQAFDPAPPRNRPRALELARFEPSAPRAEARTAPAPEVRAAPTDDELDIDEAFSILKAAEAKGAAHAQHAAEDMRAAADQPQPLPDVQPDFRPRSKREPSAELERTDWASRSHRPRSIAVIAGVVVLALGLTGGYIAGRSPHGKHGFVQINPQGGTVLRLDPNLPKR